MERSSERLENRTEQAKLPCHDLFEIIENAGYPMKNDLLNALTSVFGGFSASCAWMKIPSKSLGDKKPGDLIREGQLQLVLDYLNTLPTRSQLDAHFDNMKEENMTSEAKVIESIKLIKHNSARVDEPDDPSYPWKMEGSFRPPEFMTFAFIGLIGTTEEIVVRGMTREALDEFVELNHFATHPRLRSMTITGPAGEVFEVKK